MIDISVFVRMFLKTIKVNIMKIMVHSAEGLNPGNLIIGNWYDWRNMIYILYN
jgi:hypothetical protein